MTQRVLTVSALAQDPLDASAEFFAAHLDDANALLADQGSTSLAILLPAAGSDHDDWRRSLARNLARKHAPKRANVVGSGSKDATEAVLSYLRNAPGVTGQYLAAHE